MARIPELTRTQVQRLLDGGMEILTLPDVRSAAQAARLVQLGKFPPLGERGVSSSSAGTGFTLGSDPRRALGEADLRTSLMVMIESDEGYRALDDILEVEGIDMLTVGEMDWSVSLGLFGPEAKRALAPKIEAGDGGRPTQRKDPGDGRRTPPTGIAVSRAGGPPLLCGGGCQPEAQDAVGIAVCIQGGARLTIAARRPVGSEHAERHLVVGSGEGLVDGFQVLGGEFPNPGNGCFPEHVLPGSPWEW